MMDISDTESDEEDELPADCSAGNAMPQLISDDIW